MMFNLKKSFAALEGRLMTGQELWKAIGNIRMNAEGLGPECDAEALLDIVREKGWLLRDDNHMFRINTKNVPQWKLDEIELKEAEQQLHDAYLFALVATEQDKPYTCQKCYKMSLPYGCERVALCLSCAHELLETFAAAYPKVVAELDRLRER